MTLRAITLALGLGLGWGLGAGAAQAQGLGSMEVRVGGEDRTFVVREEAGGETSVVAPTEEAGVRLISLLAAPEGGGEAEGAEALGGDAASEAQDGPLLHLEFEAEGVGSDISTSDPRITYRDASGRVFGMREGLSGVVTVSSVTEIGTTLILGGDFSAELVPEEGDGDILGVSGSFQVTVENE